MAAAFDRLTFHGTQQLALQRSKRLADREPSTNWLADRPGVVPGSVRAFLGGLRCVVGGLVCYRGRRGTPLAVVASIMSARPWRPSTGRRPARWHQTRRLSGPIERRGHKNRHSAAPTETDPRKLLKKLAPEVGLEPTTLRLTAGCSAIELLRNTWQPWNLAGKVRRDPRQADSDFS